MAPIGHIVVAEDEEGDVQLVKRALLRASVQAPVQFARDGLEAIDLLDKFRQTPVLLLLDLHMPKLDGFEVLRWLRHQPSATQVSVVVLSSSDHSQDICQAAELGASCYIVKPNDPHELVRVMERAQELWQDHLIATLGTATTASHATPRPLRIKESTPVPQPG